MMSSSTTLGVSESIEEAAIRARRDLLSLDLQQSQDFFQAYCALNAQIQKSAASTPVGPVEPNPFYSIVASTLVKNNDDVTTAQKHYTKGFFDALRCVQIKNGQDPEQLANPAINSPQAVLSYLTSHPELMSPTTAITPTAPSDLNVILKSIAAQTPLATTLTPTISRPNGFSPVFPPSMPGIDSSTLSTPTSSSVSSSSFPSTSRPDVLNLKKEASEEPTATPETSDRSRSSSAVPSSSRYGSKINE
ncbi:hypothetical protein WR25_12625 [Diploscapter pachys]|uniref:Uncharacterized protein n=1 Tax=Diploscapter pachys TaxID=2018661 RepID=A0A2A2LYY8_9BILA|nr:hypothetical protein WR25_12625 [Diploscapter pachys]